MEREALKDSNGEDELGDVEVPWSSRLSLAQVGADSWVLLDKWTGASAPLMGSSFELGFADSDALVFNLDTEAQFEPNRLLGQDLVQSKDGELLFAVVDSDGFYTIGSSFDVNMSAHGPGVASLTLGSCKGIAKLKTYMFNVPRFGGCRCQWSLIDLYNSLKLTSYRNTPSRWVWNAKASWTTLFQASRDCRVYVFVVELLLLVLFVDEWNECLLLLLLLMVSL